MNRRRRTLLVVFLLCGAGPVSAEDHNADWLKDARYGVFVHFLPGSAEWHALTFMGARWSARDTRYPTEQWVQWIRAVVARQGVVTLDMGPNWNPQSGPIGSLSQAQIAQVKAIQAALEE